MAIAGGKGASIQLTDTLRPDALLFGEGQSRILVCVQKEKLDEVQKILEPIPHQLLGEVSNDDVFGLTYASGKLELRVSELTEAFSRPLREALA